jgi:two-component system NtrC family sensor kinase
VAHEINTPLANVMLAAESIKRRSTDPELARRAETILAQVESANRIVRGLLDFSRSRVPDREDIDLVSVAEESVAFVRGKQAAGVRVVQHHPRRPLMVRADRSQLLQVLVNILNNAYDAMDGAGTLTLRTGQTGDVAWASVTDTGPGIPESLQPKLFEPFFTTKEEGRGTGLGLSICHGIVSAHGGRIRVDSREGHGATFVVELPTLPRPRPHGTAPAAA